MPKFLLIGSCIALLFQSGLAWCQQSITANENYDANIRSRTLVGPVDGNSGFGDSTDLASGSTNFYLTVLSIPGNNDLEVALRYKFVRDRGWFNSNESSAWERDDPYLSGDFSMQAGWVLGTSHSPGPTRSTARCSRPTGHVEPPVLPSDNGRYAEFYPYEYWSGYRLVLPRGGGGSINPIFDHSPPTAMPSSGGPYKWATNDGWFFSCIPLLNGPGEGFLAVTPEGTKYFFNDYRPGPQLPSIDKFNFGGQDVNLDRQEIRIYASRIEDRFGNYVVGLAGSDGRTIALTQLANGATVATVAGRQWTVSFGNPFTVTYPDGSQWKLQTNWQISRTYPAYDGPGQHCAAVNPPISASGTGSVTVTLPSGAKGVFNFSPIVRGYSFVPLKCETPDGMNTPYVQDPSRVTEIALTRKEISGPGLVPHWVNLSFGPPNDCYGPGGYRITCTDTSPTTATTTLARSDGTSTRYTFGNRYLVNQGLLLRREDMQAGGQTLSVDTQDWQLFDAIGSGGLGAYSKAGSLRSVYRAAIKKQEVSRQGRRFSWSVPETCGSNSQSPCFDQHARPTKVVRSSAPTP